MASPLPKTGLQLRVTAIAKKGTEKNSDVEVLIDTLGRDLTFTEKNGTFNNRLSLSVGVFNKQGQVDLHGAARRRSEPAARNARTRQGEWRAPAASSVAAAGTLSAPRGRAGQRQRCGRVARISISTCPTSPRIRSRMSSVAMAATADRVGVLATQARVRSVQRPSARPAVGASRVSGQQRNLRGGGGVRQQADADPRHRRDRARQGGRWPHRVQQARGAVKRRAARHARRFRLHVPYPTSGMDARDSTCSKSKRRRG